MKFQKCFFSLFLACFLFSCGKEPTKVAAPSGQPVQKAIYKGNKYKIGVILPLTGKYAMYGESTLHGIECAAGIYSPCDGAGNVELIIKDDAGDPEKSATAVKELAKDEDVSVIVGPLSSGSIESAALKAQELGVPLVSLSQKEDITNIGDYIFSVSLTATSQVDAIVDWAIKTKKMKRFAIIYPKNPYGQKFRELFVAAVGRDKGRIVMSESYNDQTLDFLGLFKKSELREFDAVYIPDSYRSVGYITQAMNEMGIEIEKIKLLGNNRWNNKGIVERSGDLVDGAVFVDGFFEASKSRHVKEFVGAFKEVYDIEPTILEAQSFDAARLALKALTATGGAHAKDVRDALAVTTTEAIGSTGPVSFNDQREVNKHLFLLTVKKDKIEEIDAPKSPEKGKYGEIVEPKPAVIDGSKY